MRTFSGLFCLTDFSPTHNQILYRRVAPKKDSAFCNQDILFEGTRLINLPTCLEDFTIGLATEQLANSIKALCPGNDLEGRKVFIITTEAKQRYHITAIRARYQENKLSPTETSIPIKRQKPLSDTDINSIYDTIVAGGKYHEEGDEWEDII